MQKKIFWKAAHAENQQVSKSKDHSPKPIQDFVGITLFHHLLYEYKINIKNK